MEQRYARQPVRFACASHIYLPIKRVSLLSFLTCLHFCHPPLLSRLAFVLSSERRSEGASSSDFVWHSDRYEISSQLYHSPAHCDSQGIHRLCKVSTRKWCRSGGGRRQREHTSSSRHRKRTYMHRRVAFVQGCLNVRSQHRR